LEKIRACLGFADSGATAYPGDAPAGRSTLAGHQRDAKTTEGCGKPTGDPARENSLTAPSLLNLLNFAIDVPEQRELTPIKVFLQAKVGLRPNPVSHTKGFQLLPFCFDGFQTEFAKAFQ